VKRLRRIALSLVLVVLLASVFAVPAAAANPTVTITVKAELVSITNSEDTWTAQAPVVADQSIYFSANDEEDVDYSTITNTGSVAVDVAIQGTDLSGTPSWTLAATTAEDQYSLYAYNVTAAGYTIEVKKSEYNDIVVDLAADGTYDWSMNLTAPSSFSGTEDGNDKTGTVTLVATKHE
jgi:hypothetical protein